MSTETMVRPETTDYAEYYNGYIGKVPGADIMGFFEQQLDSTVRLIRGIDESKGDFRYEAGKWTVKELLGHIIDTERVFSYRGLVFSRNDQSSLPGFDQEPWAQHTNYANLTLADIGAEFESVRRSTILLFRHLNPS